MAYTVFPDLIVDLTANIVLSFLLFGICHLVSWVWSISWDILDRISSYFQTLTLEDELHSHQNIPIADPASTEDDVQEIPIATKAFTDPITSADPNSTVVSPPDLPKSQDVPSSLTKTFWSFVDSLKYFKVPTTPVVPKTSAKDSEDPTEKSSIFLKFLNYLKSLTGPATSVVSKTPVVENVPVSEETMIVSKPLFRPKPEDVLKFLAAFKCLPKTPVVFSPPASFKTRATPLAITGKSSAYLTHLDFLMAITRPKNLGLVMVPLISNPPTVQKSVVVPAEVPVQGPTTALAIPAVLTTLDMPVTETVSCTDNVLDSVI